MSSKSVGSGQPIQTTVEVDETDRRILQLLVKDARLSTREISRRIGMSPGAISERIARLEREGVITGYRAEVSAAALGHGLLAIVGIRSSHPRLTETIDRLVKIPEVETVYVVTGEFDLLIHVRLRDNRHLSEVLFERIWNIEGFQHSETMICLQQRSGSTVFLDAEGRHNEK